MSVITPLDLLKGSTSISYLSKVEFFIHTLEFKFSTIKYTRVYSSRIGRQVYTRDREARPGPVISLTLERAPLQPFQESTYPRV